MSNIETFVITDVIRHSQRYVLYTESVQFECRLSFPDTHTSTLYLDWPQIKVLSVMYCEAHLVIHPRQRKLNTEYRITVLQ